MHDGPSSDDEGVQSVGNDFLLAARTRSMENERLVVKLVGGRRRCRSNNIIAEDSHIEQARGPSAAFVNVNDIAIELFLDCLDIQTVPCVFGGDNGSCMKPLRILLELGGSATCVDRRGGVIASKGYEGEGVLWSGREHDHDSVVRSERLA